MSLRGDSGGEDADVDERDFVIDEKLYKPWGGGMVDSCSQLGSDEEPKLTWLHFYKTSAVEFARTKIGYAAKIKDPSINCKQRIS